MRESFDESAIERVPHDAEQLLIEYVVPAVRRVLALNQAYSDESLRHNCFYAYQHDSQIDQDGMMVHTEFETDNPKDEQYQVKIEIERTQTQKFMEMKNLKKRKGYMERLHEVATNGHWGAVELATRIYRDNTNLYNLDVSTVMSLGYDIDTERQQIDVSRVYKTQVDGIVLSRFEARRGEEETPIGVRDMTLEPSIEDYRGIALACRVIQESIDNETLPRG